MLHPDFLKNTLRVATERLISTYGKSEDVSHVALDGKSVTGFFDHSGNKILHSVSLWCSRLGLSLGEISTSGADRKETGEVQAAQELLKIFNLKGKSLADGIDFCCKIVKKMSSRRSARGFSL